MQQVGRCVVQGACIKVSSSYIFWFPQKIIVIRKVLFSSPAGLLAHWLLKGTLWFAGLCSV